jgi:hypothetical protein
MNKDNNHDGLSMTFEQKELFCKFCRIWELNPEFKDKKYDKFLKAYWKDKDKITPEELLELYIADFDAGKLFCRKTGDNRDCETKGSLYKTVNIFSKKKRKSYKLHAVLFAMYHGRWADSDKLVDHRDGNATNNSISNLFEATHKENANNRVQKNYNYGIRMLILKNGSKSYKLSRGGKYLGIFKTYEEAMARSLAYDKQLEDLGIKPVRSQVQ